MKRIRRKGEKKSKYRNQLPSHAVSSNEETYSVSFAAPCPTHPISGIDAASENLPDTPSKPPPYSRMLYIFHATNETILPFCFSTPCDRKSPPHRNPISNLPTIHKPKVYDAWRHPVSLPPSVSEAGHQNSDMLSGNRLFLYLPSDDSDAETEPDRMI